MTLIVREEYPLLCMIERELECNEFLLLSPEYLGSGMRNPTILCPISLVFFSFENAAIVTSANFISGRGTRAKNALIVFFTCFFS